METDSYGGSVFFRIFFGKYLVETKTFRTFATA